MAVNPKDGFWHRAKVMAVAGDYVQVEYVRVHYFLILKLEDAKFWCGL